MLVRGGLCFQVRGGRPLSANSATSFPSPFSYLFILTLFSYFLSLLPFPTSFPFSLSVPLLLSPFRFTFFFSRLPSPFFLAFSPLSLILPAPSFLFYFLFPLSSYLLSLLLFYLFSSIYSFLLPSLTYLIYFPFPSFSSVFSLPRLLSSSSLSPTSSHFLSSFSFPTSLPRFLPPTSSPHLPPLSFSLLAPSENTLIWRPERQPRVTKQEGLVAYNLYEVIFQAG